MKTIYKCTTIFLLLTFFFMPCFTSAQVVANFHITSFKAKSRNGNVDLTWKTDKEENVRQYEIESSTDGKYYKNLGFIPARDNISGDVYEFEDRVNYMDSAFYRLKIVDVNGEWLYTNPLLYKVNKTTAFLIYPSATTSHSIDVFLDDSFDFIEVVNMNGEVLLKQNLSGKTGKVSIPVSQDISAGLYVVQLKI